MRSRLRHLEALNQRLAQLAAAHEAIAQARTRELQDAREQALRVAEMDQLTGLANRASFVARLEILSHDELRTGQSFALLILDLDHFRQINDTLGHEAGDALLQHVAIRLFSFADGAEIVARLGGDEFALLIRTAADPAELERVAAEVMRLVREPATFRDRTVQTTCSIGIARFPDDGTNATDLQRHASLALDHSKLTRATTTLYAPAMGHEYTARQDLGGELASAISTGQIEAWFQPIYDRATGRIVSAEALARWRHPTRGLLAPGTFLDLAEERGLMHELFACILHSAAPIIRRRVGRGGLQSVSINVSPTQFVDHDIAADIVALLRELDLPPAALTIEITEEVLIQKFDQAAAQLERLASHGVRIALDDFGVGYSNLNYLRQFSFHTLKVDRSLIADVGSEPKVRAILAAIVVLARTLDLVLTAEGVETEMQSSQLESLGIHRQQGYLHGRPMHRVAFEQAITSSLCQTALQSALERPPPASRPLTVESHAG